MALKRVQNDSQVSSILKLNLYAIILFDVVPFTLIEYCNWCHKKVQLILHVTIYSRFKKINKLWY